MSYVEVMIKIKPFALSLFAALMLAACASAVTFDRSLNALEGRPVNDASIFLENQPSGSYTDTQGRTVYTWRGYKRESVFGDRVTKGKGYQLGGTMSDGSGVYWTGIEHYRCVIRAATVNNIIENITMEGNPGGCETIYGDRRQELGYNSSQRP